MRLKASWKSYLSSDNGDMKRVYLKDGIASTKKSEVLIGYLDENGIITPYQTVEVDSQTTLFVPVDDNFADMVDARVRSRKNRVKKKNITGEIN